MKIDPKVLELVHTTREKQELVLLGICVAGKTAYVQHKKLDQFLRDVPPTFARALPFDKVKMMIESGTLRKALKRVGMGQYSRIANAMQQVVKLNVNTMTLDQLLAISGIGPKTSRFILMYSNPDAKYAVLDTHILRWLGEVGWMGVPKSTPSGHSYLHWERRFLAECVKRNMTPLQLDTKIWQERAKKEFVNG